MKPWWLTKWRRRQTHEDTVAFIRLSRKSLKKANHGALLDIKAEA